MPPCPRLLIKAIKRRAVLVLVKFKFKFNSLWIGLIIFIIIASASCSVSEELNTTAIPWQTPIPTTYLPSTLWASSTPKFAMYPSNTPLPTPIPYPTAQIINANAVAFVASDWQGQGPSSLWVANVDGSGERKLVDITKNKISFSDHDKPQWSPNGKWISYFSNDALWVISPDGSINKKILSPDDKNIEFMWGYDWSPDGQQIAFIKTKVYDDGTSAGYFSVGILDLESGAVKMLGEYGGYISIFIKWAPNGQYVLLPNKGSYVIVNTSSGKVTTLTNLPSVIASLASWSPNSQSFFQIDHGTGCAGMWSYVTGLDGVSYPVDAGSDHQSVPVWDKTGNYLYLTTIEGGSCWGPTVEPNVKLQRFNLATNRLESLLLLSNDLWSILISPDGQIVGTHAIHVTRTNSTLEEQQEFIILDLKSMFVTKYTVNLGIVQPDNVAWSSDNQHLIVFSEEYQPISTYLYHGSFYTLDIQTGKTAIISGNHRVKYWAASPAIANP